MTIDELIVRLSELMIRYGSDLHVVVKSASGKPDSGYYNKSLKGVKLATLQGDNLSVTVKQDGRRVVIISP